MDHFVHKSPPPEFCLRQVILVYNFTIYSTNAHFNIVLPSTTKSPKRVFPSSVQTNVYTSQALRIPMVLPLRHHIAILDLTNLTMVRKAGNTKLQLFNFPHRPVLPSVTEVQEFPAIRPSPSTKIHSHFMHLML